MKITSLFILSIFALLFVNPFYGGDNAKKHLRKAQKYRNLNKFESAENEYLLALQTDPNNFSAQFELGLLYESAFYDPRKALENFQKAEKIMTDTVFELFFHLGQSYHYFEEYDEAKKYYNLYKSGIASGSDGAIVTDYSLRKIEEVQFAQSYDNHLFEGMMLNLGDKVNTGFSEYIPVLDTKDSSLLFTRRGTENLGDYYWDNMYYEDMYYSQYSNGELTQAKSFKGLDGPLDKINNTKKHESVVEISPSGDTLILYQKNKLWYSINEKGNWSEPKEFNKNINIAKYQRHGCLSPDGKTMYFSSDNKTGNGGYDIYSSKLENGAWSEAQNLGSVINTTGNEDSPFMSKDGKNLYFSSTGHKGMGDYDVFVSELVNGSWSTPVNLGTPVNSPANDIYFKIISDDMIFISSDRMGGYGNMDIYKFRPYGIPEFKNCESFEDIVENGELKIQFVGTDTIFLNEMETYSSKVDFFNQDYVTHRFWRFNDEQLEQENLDVNGNELGSEKFYLEVITRDPKGMENHYCLYKEVVVIEKPDTNVGLPANYIKLENIYFNFDKYNIRKDAKDTLDSNISKLKEHPEAEIKVIGHTDAKGSNSYNMKLAEKRAKKAVDYLIAHGIDANRIKATISKGEDDPAVPNTNADGSDNPTNRQKNRRVEFYIVK